MCSWARETNEFSPSSVAQQPKAMRSASAVLPDPFKPMIATNLELSGISLPSSNQSFVAESPIESMTTRASSAFGGAFAIHTRSSGS